MSSAGPVVHDPAAEPPAKPGVAVRCRPLAEGDFDGIVALLGQGFSDRPASYWRQGLKRLAERPCPPGVPRFGYGLDHDGTLVGVLLTIYSQNDEADGAGLRCNLSSWFVDPRYRGYGVLLDGFAMKDRSATYLNISPAPQTLPMHEARGFRRLGRDLLLAAPGLSWPRRGQRIGPFSDQRDQGLTPNERALAKEHMAYGCLCLVCSDESGARLTIFLRRTLQPSASRLPALRLPCLQLVYGLTGQAFSEWTGRLGRYLLGHHAVALVLLDTDGPLSGVRGRIFRSRKPRIVRGPHPPSVGDLSSTELVVFGP